MRDWDRSHCDLPRFQGVYHVHSEGKLRIYLNVFEFSFGFGHGNKPGHVTLRTDLTGTAAHASNVTHGFLFHYSIPDATEVITSKNVVFSSFRKKKYFKISVFNCKYLCIQDLSIKIFRYSIIAKLSICKQLI